MRIEETLAHARMLRTQAAALEAQAAALEAQVQVYLATAESDARPGTCPHCGSDELSDESTPGKARLLCSACGRIVWTQAQQTAREVTSHGE